MDAPGFERDDARKVKASHDAAGPRAERPNRLGWASTLGNAAVQRLLRSVGVQRAGDQNVLDDSLARAIQSKRGTGQSLGSSTQREMETSFGHDFSDVRVHTDAEADSLNRAVKAEAFTTGRDIFFRSGRYDPGNREGRKLLGHELTHVVQQRFAPPAQELTVSSPGDAAERQASEVGEHVSASPAAGAASLARQEEERSSEGLAAIGLQEEEEEVQQSPAVERQAEEEEEEPSE